MDRASIYFLNENDPDTYAFDEKLPPLPLPSLKDTLERYYESLIPFGNAEELSTARKIIANFENGIGKELQTKLEQRASKCKNWLETWWDTYAYHTLRIPLIPYTVMTMPLNIEVMGIPETPELLLKNLARMVYHTIEFWELLHNAKLKPLSSSGGKIKYSSALYKRFFSTSRIPGEKVDHLETHFRSAAEGKTPSYGLITGKGRLFVFDCTHQDGSIINVQEVLVILQRVRSTLDYEPIGDCVPVLTHDNRTSWAMNRQHLQEISQHNVNTLKLVESANIVVVFDENEPKNYEEISQVASYGDFHSKWSDRSSTFIAFKNGKFACTGEHSAYDGTISVSFALYIQLSLYEVAEPDWSLFENTAMINFKELHFDLDDKLKREIQRVWHDFDSKRNDIHVTHTVFDDYGKEFIKSFQLHPDSFVQVVMQLAYTRLHNNIAPTYETALMRQFYNGRTETLRSCTKEVYNFIKIITNPKSTKEEIIQSFKVAVKHHNYMMNEARKGRGIDRHLFGLWCVAFENGLEIPDLFTDSMFAKSGGGGNYILSTSTLGYTVNVGYVAPMVMDGYGVFYGITSKAIFIQTTAFRQSLITSAHKYNAMFKNTFRLIGSLLKDTQNSKL